MSGCYKFKKAECKEPACSWVVGKGCKDVDKIAEVFEGVESIDLDGFSTADIYKTNALKAAVKQNSVDVPVAKPATETLNNAMSLYLWSLFRDRKTGSYTENNLSFVLPDGFKTGPLLGLLDPASLAKTCASYCRAANYDSKFDESARRYLAAAMEAVIMGIAVVIAENVKVDKKKRIESAEVLAGLSKNRSLRSALKKAGVKYIASPVAAPAAPVGAPLYNHAELGEYVKQVHPNLSISKEGADWLNSALRQCLEKAMSGKTLLPAKTMLQIYGDKAGKEAVAKKVATDRLDRLPNRLSEKERMYTAGVLEYLVLEILEQSGNAALNSRSKRIEPAHFKEALQYDADLHKVFA